MSAPVADVDEKVAVRMARQRLIDREADPIRVVAVLDEAVLCRKVGGPEVMGQQLRRLVDLSRRSNVDLRVIPFDSGAHCAMDGPFYLLEFPEPGDPDIVYLEQAVSGLVPEDSAELRHYTLMFGNLMATALPPKESIAFIATIAHNGDK